MFTFKILNKRVWKRVFGKGAAAMLSKEGERRRGREEEKERNL